MNLRLLTREDPGQRAFVPLCAQRNALVGQACTQLSYGRCGGGGLWTVARRCGTQRQCSPPTPHARCRFNSTVRRVATDSLRVATDSSSSAIGLSPTQNGMTRRSTPPKHKHVTTSHIAITGSDIHACGRCAPRRHSQCIKSSAEKCNVMNQSTLELGDAAAVTLDPLSNATVPHTQKARPSGRRGAKPTKNSPLCDYAAQANCKGSRLRE